MLFSWANKQLERLAETVAPISTSNSSHRFLSFLASGDEQSALQCFHTSPDPSTPPLDPRAILNPSKGNQPIHSACEHCAMTVVKILITEHGVTPDGMDYKGNTALHYAASSRGNNGSYNPIDLVKLLVTEFGASVISKNEMGQTPYDLSGDTMVRQYLLPLQLQQETKQCLDEGKSLPPGTDLGGFRRATAASAIPPPPVMGAPPVGMPPSQQPDAIPPSYDATLQQLQTPPPFKAPSQPSSAPPSYVYHHSTSLPEDSVDRRFIKPDGFHSSASDIQLQQKYGHVKVDAPRSSPLPPPPTFATASSSSAPQQQQPPSVPVARSKYLAYDAVTGTTSLPPPPQFTPMMQPGGGHPAAATTTGVPNRNVQVFNPGAVNDRSNQQNPASPKVPPE